MTRVVWSHAAPDVASATRGNSGIRSTPPVPTAALLDGCGCVCPHPRTQFPGKFLGALAPALQATHQAERAPTDAQPGRLLLPGLAGTTEDTESRLQLFILTWFGLFRNVFLWCFWCLGELPTESQPTRKCCVASFTAPPGSGSGLSPQARQHGEEGGPQT